METTHYISANCRIRKNQIFLNGRPIFTCEALDFADFSKKAYQHFEMSYPKFFKMDNLSKLGFIGAELILSTLIDMSNKANTALVFANSSSSLDTDVKYQKSIGERENYFPSPAIFVYTLPNISLGEISIRHQLKTENSFFIFEAFNPELMANYANLLLNTGKAESVLCGWTEYFNEEYNAFFWLVSDQGNLPHNQQTLETEYNR